MKHELKCWPEFYRKIIRGDKTFEIRKNDRDFNEGDELWLREWHPVAEEYSGRETAVEVTYLIRGGFGLLPNWCCMSIRKRT